MSDYANRRISEAELSVMEALWDLGKSTAKDLQGVLKERRGWERTTVRSLLTRLQDKGSVTLDKDAEVATYIPAFTREEYSWDLNEVLLERMYDGDSKALVADLLAHGLITKEDLKALCE